MALFAAFIFSWTSIFFTEAGQRLGVRVVNLVRLPAGVLCLALAHMALNGRWWPAEMGWQEQVWIGMSGVAGLAIGDSALFSAFTSIGPRRSMTVMALSPVFTVMVAWSLLGEHLGPRALFGIVVIIGGVMMATMGRGGGSGRFRDLSKTTLRTGLLMALIGAAGQGLGSVFAKQGMGPTGGGIDPLGATLVRMSWAAIAYWAVLLPSTSARDVRDRLRDRRGSLALVIAILLGPFISVWISLVAIKHTEAGVAQVLLGMVPVFVLVPAWLVHRDRPTVLSLLGVIMAMGGGAVLFLR